MKSKLNTLQSLNNVVKEIQTLTPLHAKLLAITLESIYKDTDISVCTIMSSLEHFNQDTSVFIATRLTKEGLENSIKKLTNYNSFKKQNKN